MKKRRLITLLTGILLAFTALFSGCTIDFSGTDKVMKMKYVEWKAESPDIFFRTLDDNGNGFGYVTISEEKKDAYFYFDSKHNLVIELINRDIPLPEFVNESSCSLSMTYKDNVLKTADNSINLFGAEYSEIAFTKTEVDRSRIDASEYFRATWADADERLSFTLPYPVNNAFCGNGIAITSVGEKEVIFVWGKEKTFAIYLSQDLDSESEPVAEGTYTNTQTEATLSFTYDSLFNLAYPTLTINAK